MLFITINHSINADVFIHSSEKDVFQLFAFFIMYTQKIGKSMLTIFKRNQQIYRIIKPILLKCTHRYEKKQ